MLSNLLHHSMQLFIHSFIHLSSGADLEPIPGTLGVRQKCNPEISASQCTMNTYSHLGAFSSAKPSIDMFLGVGRKRNPGEFLTQEEHVNSY